MHQLINSVTSIPETNTLLFLGGGLILAALFLRRVVSVIAYASNHHAKSVDGTKEASAK
jgi:hypothetical protein